VVETRRSCILRRLDPSRQLLAATVFGHVGPGQAGHLTDVPACTDLVSRPWIDRGRRRRGPRQPFFARGNVATAGGCLASTYLATWIIARLHSLEAAKDAVALRRPRWRERRLCRPSLRNVSPYLDPAATSSAHSTLKPCRCLTAGRTSFDLGLPTGISAAIGTCRFGPPLKRSTCASGHEPSQACVPSSEPREDGRRRPADVVVRPEVRSASASIDGPSRGTMA
jgi:hypothetical protein